MKATITECYNCNLLTDVFLTDERQRHPCNRDYASEHNKLTTAEENVMQIIHQSKSFCDYMKQCIEIVINNAG